MAESLQALFSTSGSLKEAVQSDNKWDEARETLYLEADNSINHIWDQSVLNTDPSADSSWVTLLQ